MNGHEGYNDIDMLGQDAGVGAAGIVPGPMPGQIQLPTGEIVELSDWTQAPIYDTEIITAVTGNGTEYTYFRNLAFPAGARKNERFTNMVTQHQLPSGWRAIVYGVHFYVLPVEIGGVWTTPEDIIRVLTLGTVKMTTGNQKIEREGPLMFFPNPYGVSGPMTFAGAALHEVSALNNGVASMTAVPYDRITIDLRNEMTFEATVKFPDGAALDHDCYLQCVLRTLTRKPVR